MNDDFADLADMRNEAGVEAHFMLPLLKQLGYYPSDMMLKEAISALPVGQGRRKVIYRPDAILLSDGIPAVVVDAKGPGESLQDWESQCASYCLEINKLYDYNPVQFFVLTNAAKTQIYRWDRSNAFLTVSYAEIKQNSQSFDELSEYISKSSVRQEAVRLKDEIDQADFRFETVGLGELNDLFKKLHDLIWRVEKKSPSSAFTELMKIVFVKISKDRELHEKLGDNPKPRYKDVVFSSHWLSAQSESSHPLNDPLFKNLLGSLEAGIASGRKKRFFDKSEEINVSPDTILRIVKELEHIDFYSMEEDIHGRLFESFLDATVRGKDIGQFFTPRDIVDLMVDLGQPVVTRKHVDSVLDACCGSGGFLIASMRKMLKDVSSLTGLSSQEKSDVSIRVREESLFGIDAGSDPAMYRIARMNMYLHGDGGSKIYFADSLDKNLGSVGADSIENRSQLDEARNVFRSQGKKFDLILSNPPFSLKYSREDPEQARVLNQYDLSIDHLENKVRSSLLSSVMYIELYKDLVADGGRILAIVDDSVLSGESYKYIREFIRTNFIISAVISLPGDAFRRSAARVKTSVLILRKKMPNEVQSDVFMTSAKYVGLEEAVAKRVGINPGELVSRKSIEHKQIVSGYKKYLEGTQREGVIPYSNLADRLDVKFCINDRGRKQALWKDSGYDVTTLGEVLDIPADRKTKLVDEQVYPLLRVTYDGEIQEGDILTKETSSYSALYEVREWDLLISNMGFGRGAVGIVPPHHSGKYVSNEYTIVRAGSQEATVFYANLLRTKEILADVLSLTTGMNRGRIKWDVISQVSVPTCDTSDPAIQALVAELKAFWAAFGKFSKNRDAHVGTLVERFNVDGDDAHERWLGFKPPE